MQRIIMIVLPCGASFRNVPATPEQTLRNGHGVVRVKDIGYKKVHAHGLHFQIQIAPFIGAFP